MPFIRFRDMDMPMGFFNRKEEIEALRNVLKSDTQLSVITGPVNSGKSLLLRKIIHDMRKTKVPVLYINLRNVSFNSVNSFITVMEEHLDSWLRQQFKAARKYRLNASAYGLNFRLERIEGKDLPVLTKLDLLFQKISARLPPRNFWGKVQLPIFVIDEANELSALMKDPDGQDALINLFKWMVLNTKEINRFHAMLVSSDSFFHLWVADYIGSSRYVNYVIGDLDKEDAEQYWVEQLICLCDEIPPPNFEDAYKVCGGNMFLLKKFMWEHVISKGKVRPQDFFMITQEKNKLMKTMCDPILKDNLLPIMKELVKAQTGFLYYDEVCTQFGKASVD